MSLQRCASPAAASGSIFRFTSASLARTCPLATRTFSYSASNRFSAKRKLMTESSYRPHAFDFPPPPPRNSDVPESSIAGGETSTVNRQAAKNQATAATEQNPPRLDEKYEQNAQPSIQKASKDGFKEPSRPKRKLRARKAAMTLSATAVEHLKELLEMPDPKLIRVGVKNRGCSGLAYHLEYVDKPGTFDETLEQDGVKVLIDSKALFSIIGSEMDWVEDKLSQRFVFKNPNITEQCGCGESFSVG